MTRGQDGSRLAWVDAARGLAILLVVFYHAVLFTDGVGLAVAPWGATNEALRSFRMPLFFLVSGLLVSNSLQRPWKTLARSKFAVWVWLYLLWSIINFAIFSVVPWERTNDPADSWTDVPGILGWPNNALWYLYALALFLVLLRLSNRAPAWVAIGVAGVLAYLFGDELVATGNFAFDNMGRYFLFFALGARAPELVKKLAARADGRAASLIAVVYVVLTCAVVLISRRTGMSIGEVTGYPLLRPLLGVLAAATGVVFAVRVADRSAGRLLVQFGQQTLPIYVAHEIVLGCMFAALSPAVDALPARIGAVIPLLFTALAVAITLGLHRLLGRVPGLYAPPRWLTRNSGERRATSEVPDVVRRAA